MLNLLRRSVLVLAPLLAGLWLAAPGLAQPDKKKGGFGPKNRDQVVDAAVAYLKSTQAADGTWGKPNSAGITGLVLTALLRSGKVTANEPAAAEALQYIESLVDEKTGHIAGGGAKVFQTNYVTTVNVIALQSAGADKKYASVVQKAVAFLKKLQWDEAEGKTPKDAFYGGVGYGAGTRPDLSNTHFFLDALVDASVPKDDPVYKKALVFVSRCQNLKGETNDQPWAGKINDGSFIYVLGGGKKGGAETPPDQPRPGYGSMTYAGLKSLADCGLSREDPRFKKAQEWVRKHYSVDVNPGMAAGSGQRGYYYYLVTMAKCLDTLKVNEVVDAEGVKHDWRANIVAALASRQRKDGSWSNETATWMESNPDLCTAYALIALSYCTPKTK